MKESLPARSIRPLYPMGESVPGIAGEAELVETGSDQVEGQGGDVEEDDIARRPRVARRPAAPTKAMIMAHEVHHADYREWCAHCVAGKESVTSTVRQTRSQGQTSQSFVCTMPL